MGKANIADRVGRLEGRGARIAEAVRSGDFKYLSDREILEYLESTGAPAGALAKVTDEDLAGIAEGNPEAVQDAELQAWLRGLLRGGPSLPD